MLDVAYRHLVFTLPWELRLLIQDNPKRLLNVLFRAAADAVLSLTAGNPAPKGRQSIKWLKARKRHKPYVAGLIAISQTFGSDIKWNPHLASDHYGRRPKPGSTALGIGTETLFGCRTASGSRVETERDRGHPQSTRRKALVSTPASKRQTPPH